MPDITTVVAAVSAWTRATTTPDEAAAILLPVLSPDVTAALPTGEAQGPEAVAAAAASPRLMQAMDGATWSEVSVDADVVRTRATAPAGAVIGGLDVAFTVSDGRVTRVEETVVPAAPPDEQPVSLLGAVADVLDDALAKGVPVVVAYVQPDGQPSLSLRGSVKVHSDHEIQVWVRKAEGGLAGALESGHDRVTFWYRNGPERSTLLIKGRGRVVADPALRRAVYDSTVEPERRADAQYRGVAVLVEVHRVEGRLPGGGVRMVGRR
jgi:hypothetical protein